MADGSDTWGGWGLNNGGGVKGRDMSGMVVRGGVSECLVESHLGVATAALEFGSQAAAGWLIGVGGGAVAHRGQGRRRGGQESVRGEGGALGSGGGEPLGGGRRSRDWRKQAESS